METKTICMITSIHPDFDARIMKEVRSLVNYGFKVDLICPWKFNNVDIAGVNFLTFKGAARRTLRFMNYFRISKYLIKRRYDLYHFHDIDILPLFCIVKLLARRPIIYDIHENYPDEMLLRFWVPMYLRRILYYLVRYVQRVCAYYIRNLILVVPSQEEEFRSSKYNKIIIRNFAPKDLLKAKKSNYDARRDVIVFTGSQYENNGSLLLLDIAKCLKSVCPDVRIHVSDRFYDKTFYKKVCYEIESRGLRDFVQLVPNVSPHQIMSVLNKATIAISPNLRVPKQIRAIPTKLFEYMAAGLPVVTSDLPHQVEVIGGAHAGLLAQPEDPDSFVKAIQLLVNDRQLAKELGKNGLRAFQERYSWESQIPAMLYFYEKILSKKGGQI